jgi:outer membrane lipoprotein SlyB
MTVTSTDGTRLDVKRSNGTSRLIVNNSAGTRIGNLVGNQVNFLDGSYFFLN